jgi:processive 1,2-diacylglycerol beta-glucosyltransferase
MPSKKILILYNSIGLGHKSIAENIGYYLEQDGYQIKLADILQVQGNWLSSAGAWLYHIFLLWLPFVWSFLYLNKTVTDVLLKFRTKTAGKNYQRVKEVIDGFQPDAVISTHTVSSSIVSYLKSGGMYSGKFVIAFSDFHLHRFWLYDNADLYLINIEEQKQQMVGLGISAEKITICGMTLKPQITVDTKAVQNRLGIGAEDKVVLISSGSQGTDIDKALLKFFADKSNIKTIVVCGKNQQLHEKLKVEFAGTNIIPLGFYKPMDELYAISDVYITKPGGLSTAEALRWNLPMLISHVLPGQEELNFKYLTEKQLVVPWHVARERHAWPVNLEAGAMAELQTGTFRRQLIVNTEKLALFPAPESLLKAMAGLWKTQ